MMRKIAAGSTSQAIPIFAQDSTSTSGAGLGSLVFNTSGLAAKYRRQGDSTWTTITLATATVGTWATGGFVADGGPVTGGYELGLPNAVLASSAGVTWAEVAVYGATNMLPVLIFIELDAVNYQDAVHFGLSALPNTAVSTNASLITSGTGTDQLSVSAGKTLLQATQTGVTIPTVTTVTNQLTAAQVATVLWQDTTAGDFTVANSIGKSLYTSGNAPGAANGLQICGSNAGVTFASVTVSGATTYTGLVSMAAGLSITGAAASGATPATAGLTIAGGAASTTSGGTSAPAARMTGGAGAASTNGSAAGIAVNAGGTTTVSGNDAATYTATGNGSGVTLAHAGTGKDLNAQTTNALQANATAINAVSTSSVTAVNANVGTTQPVNFSGTGSAAYVKVDIESLAGNTSVSTGGRIPIDAPFVVNTAAGFSFRMVQSGDNKTAYTSPVSLAGSRTIAGGTSAAVSGTITQVGSTNEYYFSGLAADFNGAEVHFAFTATGANPVYVTVNPYA